jgi:lipoyl(octanoyl) transferase
MKNQLLAQIKIHDFDLTEDNLSQLNAKTILVKKWNWQYAGALEFQRAGVKLLQEIRDMRILICCNHPQVLTHGRGLQRPRKGEVLELKQFSATDHPETPYPVYQIERGGGLTFHHPGQFVFYPILKLNPHHLSLSQMIESIFAATAGVLKNWGIEDLDYHRQLMGLWYGDKKLASMGVAIQKLTTFHGMALNLFKDDQMLKAMDSLNPCGLSSQTYMAVEEIIKPPDQALELFTEQFLQRLLDGWK